MCAFYLQSSILFTARSKDLAICFIAYHDPVVCEGGNIPAYLSICSITADIVRRGFIMGGLLTIIPGSLAPGRLSLLVRLPRCFKNYSCPKPRLEKAL